MKVERLLAIVMLLLNKDKITATELAENFEVSVRTIIRDMEAINLAGIPIVSHQGKNGGFSILRNYKVDKSFLTPNEIASMIRALEGVNKAYDDRNIDNIIEKVQGLIPNDRKESINKQSQKLIIDLTPWDTNNPQKKKVDIIKQALDENRLVSFNYINTKSSYSKRVVEPVTLVLKIHTWYLYGYCKFRNDYRFFKLGRMKELHILEEQFIPREKSIEELPWQKEWNSERNIQHIVLKFTSKVRVAVEEYFDGENITIQEDGSLIVRISYPEDSWVYSMILSYGNDVEVLEPQHIRHIIKDKAEKIFNIYN